MKKKYCFLEALIFIFLFCSCSYAAGESAKIATASDAVYSALSAIGNNLSGTAIDLFMGLAVLELFWNCYQLLIEGKLEAQSFVMTLCKTIIILCVFNYVVLHAHEILGFISNYISEALADKPGDISSLIKTAFKMAAAPKDALNALSETADHLVSWQHPINCLHYGLAMIVIGIADLIILIAMFMAYITALVTKAKLVVVMSFAILALGFSGSQFTRDIAMNGIRTTIAVSVELLVIYALIGASEHVFDSFLNTVLIDWPDAYNFAWQCVMAGIILSALFQQVPGVVSGIFGPGGGSGGNALVGASMAISAASMAKSAASMAKSTGGSVARGAGKVAGGAARTIAGTTQAIRQHMPSAPPSIAGSKSGLQKTQEAFGRFNQGVSGAAKEGFTNRVSSLKESLHRNINNSADRVMGRKPNDIGKG